MDWRITLQHSTLRHILVSWVADNAGATYPLTAHLETTLDGDGNTVITVVIQQPEKSNVIPFPKK